MSKQKAGSLTVRVQRARIVRIMRKAGMNVFLATVDRDQPRVRAMAPIVDDDLTVWMMTGAKNRKVSQIRRNPKVCALFSVLPDGIREVTVLGRARIVNDRKLKQRVWNQARFDPTSYYPAGPTDKNYCLLQIRARRIEWREGWTRAGVYP